jgi:hypothetical protein
MVTVEQIITYVEQTLAQRLLANDREGLRRLQLALGELMAAASSVDDRATAMRFRVLAARAANQREAISGDE